MFLFQGLVRRLEVDGAVLFYGAEANSGFQGDLNRSIKNWACEFVVGRLSRSKKSHWVGRPELAGTGGERKGCKREVDKLYFGGGELGEPALSGPFSWRGQMGTPSASKLICISPRLKKLPLAPYARWSKQKDMRDPKARFKKHFMVSRIFN